MRCATSPCWNPDMSWRLGFLRRPSLIRRLGWRSWVSALLALLFGASTVPLGGMAGGASYLGPLLTWTL